MKAILDLMKKRGLTQKNIADLIGKTQPTVNSIIKGKSNLQPDDAKILINKFPKILSWEKIYGDANG